MAQEQHQNNALIEAHLVKRLLSDLGVFIDTDALNSVYDKLEGALPQVRPVEWLQQVFLEAQLKGIQPVQLGWRRFDQRLLPALVCHEACWYLAERLDSETITLTRADDESENYPEEYLQNALVIWLRVPAKMKSEPFSLKGNLAAGLVWKEMFREPGWLGKVLAATVLVNLIAVATSIFALQVYDRVVPTQAYATLTTLVGGMVLIVT
ncbi:MAG: hypothetical protein Q9M31_08720, partial [Mariprofundus sp.]|nr:hypothetical protein [Mariprofundus sp.]